MKSEVEMMMDQEEALIVEAGEVASEEAVSSVMEIGLVGSARTRILLGAMSAIVVRNRKEILLPEVVMVVRICFNINVSKIFLC